MSDAEFKLTALVVLAALLLCAVVIFATMQVDYALDESLCGQYALINPDLEIKYFKGGLKHIGCMAKVNGRWVNLDNIHYTLDGEVFFGELR